MTIALEKLITEFYEFSCHVEKMQEELKEKRLELTRALLEADTTEFYNQDGIGYKVVTAPCRYEYRKSVYPWLKEKNLEQFFLEIKITRAKIDDLKKQNILTEALLEELNQYTITTEGVLTVRKEIKKGDENELGPNSTVYPNDFTHF